MHVEFESHTVAADSSGSGNAVRGRLAFVQFKRPASGAYDPGATVTVSVVRQDYQDVVVLNSVDLANDAIWYPRSPVHDSDGSAITGLAEHHVLADARVQVAVSGGGANNTGAFLVAIER